MRIQPLAPSPPTRPVRASAAASRPPDTVELGPSQNPWPELGRLGVLTAASSLNGPIGSVVNQQVREALCETVRRLHRAGVTFRYHEPRPIPLLRPEYTDLTPRHVTELLMESSPTLDGRLEMALPARQPKPLVELNDLRLADGWLGAPVLDPSEQSLHDTLRALHPLQFYPLSQQEFNGNFIADLKQLHAGGSVRFLFPYGGSDTVDARKLRAIDFLIGSRQDPGDTLAPRARLLARARDQKFKFYDEDLNPTDLASTYMHGLDSMYVRQGESVKLPVSERDLEDLPALERKLADWDAVYRQVLMTPFRAAGFDPDNDNIPPVVLEASIKYTPVLAAAVFGALVEAGSSSGRAIQNADSLVRQLFDECHDAYELARKTRMVCATYEKEGFQAAEDAWNRTQDALLTRSGENAPLREELEEIYFQLLSATGSFSATEEGLDLVRVRIGSETQEERLGLFRDIARRLPAGEVEQAAACYRSVLAERREDDSLLETGHRFCSLLHTMALGRHQERALEVFGTLQSATTGGSRDERVKKFLSQLVLCDDVDQSLQAALAGGPGGRAETGVRVMEDAIFIAGVRVPRKRAAEPTLS